MLSLLHHAVAWSAGVTLTLQFWKPLHVSEEMKMLDENAEEGLFQVLPFPDPAKTMSRNQDLSNLIQIYVEWY